MQLLVSVYMADASMQLWRQQSSNIQSALATGMYVRTYVYILTHARMLAIKAERLTVGDKYYVHGHQLGVTFNNCGSPPRGDQEIITPSPLIAHT
jgi:hypothetical protein